MSEPPKSLDRRAASLVFVASLSSFAIKPFLREVWATVDRTGDNASPVPACLL